MGKLSLTGNSATRSRLAVLGPAFSPADVGNLWAWFDASNAASITESSGAVSQWNDLSGNGRHVTQSTGGNKPTTNSRSINGLNVLDFDGGDFIARTAAIGFTTGAYTVCMFIGSDADSSSFLRFMSFHNGSGNDYDSNNAFTITQGNASAQMTIFQGSVNLAAGGASGATPIATWIVRKDTGTNQYQITGSAVLSAQTTNSSSGTANGGFVFGAGYESGVLGTNPFNGPIGEIIIYSAAISDANRTAIQNYLVAKWGA